MQIFGRKIELELGEERTQLLICIGIACGFWVLMKLSGDFSTTRHIHLEYVLPPMMEFVETPPDHLEATVTGSGLSLIGDYLKNPHPSILIDLQQAPRPGVERQELLSQLEGALSVSVKNVNLNYLYPVLDSMATKKVPVVPQVKFDLAPDHFLLDTLTISHDSVLVSGTPDLLKKVTEVRTETIVLSGSQADLQVEAALQKPLEGGVQVIPSVVYLSGQVGRFTEKTLQVPIRLPELADSVQLIPSEVRVRCVVEISHFAALSSADLTVVADIHPGIELDQQNLVPVTLSVAPKWVRSVEISPPVVEYFLVR